LLLDAGPLCLYRRLHDRDIPIPEIARWNCRRHSPAQGRRSAACLGHWRKSMETFLRNVGSAYRRDTDNCIRRGSLDFLGYVREQLIPSPSRLFHVPYRFHSLLATQPHFHTFERSPLAEYLI
jgi:hypothetical protein